MLDIAFVKPALPRHGALVLPLAEDAALAGLAQVIDQASGGAIARALAAAAFKGRKGQSCIIWAPSLEGGAPGPAKLVAIGLGKADELSAETLEAAGGATLALVSAEREAVVAAEALAAPHAAAFALGLLLKSYRFDRYRTTEKDEDKPKLERAALATDVAAAAKAAWAPMRGVADGVFLARDLVSEPPNILHPEEMAERCKELEKLGVEVEILTEKDMKKLGMRALLGVAQGSPRPPRLVVMSWNGAKGKERPLAFVGKGVVFDTGGNSIKPAAGMEDMKGDMGGAAAVTGLMHALAARNARVNAIGIIGCVENSVDGNAQRPGDIVASMSGQTIEVLNTDAEGRLVLADALWYCAGRFRPRFMVDLATLTGAIMVALGQQHAGLFANDDELAGQLLAAGQATQERLWRMPLGADYDKLIDSKNADVKNIGGRYGGSITAAQFLQRFVKDTAWAHLDIAGTAMGSPASEINQSWASGFGVRLLDRLVRDHYEA